MIKVLHAVPDMNSGGIENYIMNMYRIIDRDTVHFDFLVHHNSRGFFDDEIEELGGRIYRLPVLDNKNVISYWRELKRLYSENNWDVVHGHAASLAGLYLFAAEKAGVRARIAHSHGASYLRTPKGYTKKLLFKTAGIHANIRLACSTEAGKYLFGDRQFYLAKNAIDSERFSFNQDDRDRIRRSLGIVPGQLLVGHMGRFNLQKNHQFLIEIFEEIVRMKPDSCLLLVGTGERESSIRNLVSSKGLNGKVIFQSVTDEPQAYYSAMDAFVLPSLFEGLPLVGIEAQCSGLPSYFSSEITKEVVISDIAEFLDLNAGPVAWAQQIVGASSCINRRAYADRAAIHGFDFRDNTKKMTDFYLAAATGRFESIGSILD